MAKERNPQTSLNAPPDQESRREAKLAIAEKGKAAISESCCGPRHFWAVVETDGTLVRGRNVWRVDKIGKGMYEVIFTSDVSEGVYNATIGRPGIRTEPPGEICVALRCCLSGPETNKGVWIDTHDSSGNFEDRAFHLVVHLD
ncbi:MAG: hypothetical protein KDC43_26030 [Saprospiraceae bacterium]|nr:hypothetical protein [Saprospiraceae bacterium]MCB0627280.1 hypothetical protein [Saprospiraceae bacterium]MCB0684562.1 hypothetical protein [Saprospiraceae bacterium]